MAGKQEELRVVWVTIAGDVSSQQQRLACRLIGSFVGVASRSHKWLERSPRRTAATTSAAANKATPPRLWSGSPANPTTCSSKQRLIESLTTDTITAFTPTHLIASAPTDLERHCARLTAPQHTHRFHPRRRRDPASRLFCLSAPTAQPSHSGFDHHTKIAHPSRCN